MRLGFGVAGSSCSPLVLEGGAGPALVVGVGAARISARRETVVRRCQGGGYLVGRGQCSLAHTRQMGGSGWVASDARGCREAEDDGWMTVRCRSNGGKYRVLAGKKKDSSVW